MSRNGQRRERSQKPRKEPSEDPAEQTILQLLRAKDYLPLDSLGITRAVRRKTRIAAPQVTEALDRLERLGKIVRIKRDRYALPQDADLITGRIQFRASGSAWVAPDLVADDDGNLPAGPKDRSLEITVFQEDAGTALHGDKVVVRVDTAPRIIRGKETRTGRVIRILERANRSIVGVLQRSRHYFHVVPDDPRIIHDILVPDPALSKLKPVPKIGDKVVVRMLEWTQRHAPPEGEISEVIGRNTEPGVELRAIFLKHKLPETFPKDVLAEVAHLPDRVPEEAAQGREDFRNVPTCTIDPDDAKDFDDALSLETLPNGDLRIGVHIADVSHYVKPGTALDREARQRGNSTYLIGTVVPMLPEKLSNGLCSLVEGEDRLTKAAIFVFSPDGRMKDARLANTIIRSRKRLTYKQAYALMFEDSLQAIRAVKPPPSHQTGSPGRPLATLNDDELRDLQRMVRNLWGVAAKLRRERMENGSLDLEMPETKIFVDEAGWADRIERIENDESHQLIEEFMLLANETVARRTREQKLPSVYRVHDDPDLEKLSEFRELAATVGIQIGDLGIRSQVVLMLQRLREHPQGYTLRTQFLRSLRKACYRADPDGHYGLAKKDYTHFTSPIRRYADLIVHRVVAFDLTRTRGRPPYSPGEIRTLAEHISLTEVTSAEAEREHHKIKLVEFFERDLKRDPRSRFPAVITDIRNHGLFIELTEPFLLGFIHVSALRDDFYALAHDGRSMVGRKTRKTLSLGQHVWVEIDRVDRIKRQFDFRVAEGAPPPPMGFARQAAPDRAQDPDKDQRTARKKARPPAEKAARQPAGHARLATKPDRQSQKPAPHAPRQRQPAPRDAEHATPPKPTAPSRRRNR